MARKHWVSWGRTALRGVSVAVVLAVAGVVAVMFQSGEPNKEAVASAQSGQLPESGWGAESLEVAEHTGGALQLIPLANACGLGASSCFKCHNGKRAEKPSTMDWHTQHSSVNNSCAGCHNGNPRLLKKSIAHRDLIINPVKQPEPTCFSCHSGGDAQALVGKYENLFGGGE